jgi:Flp pilus assembly protein TadG
MWAKPSGQALAEFGVVAVAFGVLLFAIFEMGTVVYQYNTVSEAAREAVRYAVVHSPTSQNPATNDQIAGVAVTYAPFLSSTDVTVSFPPDTNPHLVNQIDARVSISHDYTQNIPLMSAVTLHLTTSSQMLVSQ